LACSEAWSHVRRSLRCGTRLLESVVRSGGGVVRPSATGVSRRWVGNPARVQPDACETWQLNVPVATLWRSTTQLQLGLEPPAGLLLTDPPSGLREVVEALAQPRGRPALERIGGPGAPLWLDPLLDLLAGAGMMRPTARAAGPVSIIGQGPLAVLLTELLLDELDGPVRLVWPGSPGVPRAATALRERYPDRLHCVGHWSYSSADPRGLIVVAAQAVEAERSLLTQLESDAQPYLVVRACDVRTAVGPLVVPGRSACQRCDDLHRSAVDPAWPRLLVQLCTSRPAARSAALHWAAATGAAHAVSFLEGALPDSLGGALELDEGSRLRLRRLRAHPACGCLQFG